jgi:hypothetical protein
MMMFFKFSRIVGCIYFVYLMLIGMAALASEGSHVSDLQITLPKTVDDPVMLSFDHKQQKIDLINSSEAFHVYVGNSNRCCTNRSPIIGDYKTMYNKQTGEYSLSFIPRFGFVEDQSYVIRIKELHENNSVSHRKVDFTIESAKAIVKPIVTSIYPSGNVLPENTLRFYIHFSRPMKPNVAVNHIKLVDSLGRVDDSAFMHFKQELWSADRKRLTLLMDPGRIKRGVATNIALGPALQEGEQYQLIVDGQWPTANGKDNLAPFSKPFRAGAPLRQLPDINTWIINRPTVDTKETLTIIFGRPFDHALLFKDIKILTANGKQVQGTASVKNSETVWKFSPDKNWHEKTITIVVDSELEDVAGNNFKDLLDHTIEAGTKNIKQLSIPVHLQ